MSSGTKFREEDYIGKRFGRLVVIERLPDHLRYVNGRITPIRERLFSCVCDCGNEKLARSTALGRNVNSCGCLVKDINGNQIWGKEYQTGTRTYNIYHNMKTRCCNPQNKGYGNYGGRGIKICDRWLGDSKTGYKNFVEDMGQCPSPLHTIERVDVNGDYCPENCVWTDDLSLQAYNKTKRSTNTSGRTGVTKEGNRWLAYICKDYKHKIIARCLTYEEAVQAREAAEKEIYGFIKEENKDTTG